MNHYYLDAAELVANSLKTDTGNHEYACHALGAVIPFNGHFQIVDRHKKLFAAYFKPRGKDTGAAWFGSAVLYTGHDVITPAKVVKHTKNCERRIFALLFMHEITKGTEV